MADRKKICVCVMNKDNSVSSVIETGIHIYEAAETDLLSLSEKKTQVAVLSYLKEQLEKRFGDDKQICLVKYEGVKEKKKKVATSRADRFSEAQGLASDAKSRMEELRDELQNWYDNLPENLQSGSKADTLQSAIDELERCVSSLDEVESASVEFPSMFG